MSAERKSLRQGRKVRRVRFVAALTALLSGFSLAGFSLGTVASATPSNAASLPTAVSNTAVSNAAARLDVALGSYGQLRVGDDLGLTVTVTNTSDLSLDAGTAQIFLGPTPVTDHRILSDWFTKSGGATELGPPVVQLAVPALFPGEAVTLPTTTVPAATLGVAAQRTPGARKLAVRLLSGSATKAITEFHTSVTTTTAPAAPARLAIAMPLVLPPSSTAVLSADLIAQYTSPTGVLTRQLDQAYATPVAIAIDPRILSSIRQLGSSIPASAALWLERLQSAPNTTFALSFADSDLAATSQAGLGVLAPDRFVINPALFPTITTPPRPPSPTPSPSPSGPTVNPALPTSDALLSFPYTLSGIAWPREHSVVDSDLVTFANAGLTTTILGSGNSSLAASASIAGATATISGRAILNSDDDISARLRDAVEASTEAGWQSAMARLNSTLATLSTNNQLPTTVTLATLARTPTATAANFRLAETLAALATMTWTTPTSLAAAFAEKPVSASITARPASPSRVAALRQMLASENAVAQFSALLTDPVSLTAERHLALLALSAQSWLPIDADWVTAVSDYVHRSTTILDSVKVVNSSTINLLSNRGQLPITVNNALPYPVTVYVIVRSQTAVLNIQEPRVKLTVEANSQNRAFVPVQSIANGEVTIVVGLASATGHAVGQQALATINVQAGWETAATAVLAVFVVVIFILGIIRTARRRRRIHAQASS